MLLRCNDAVEGCTTDTPRYIKGITFGGTQAAGATQLQLLCFIFCQVFGSLYIVATHVIIENLPHKWNIGPECMNK